MAQQKQQHGRKKISKGAEAKKKLEYNISASDLEAFKNLPGIKFLERRNITEINLLGLPLIFAIFT